MAYLGIRALVLSTVDGGAFEVHCNCPVGNLRLSTLVFDSDIVGFDWNLVVNLVSCSIGQLHRTGELLEMMAVNMGNHSPVVDKTD